MFHPPKKYPPSRHQRHPLKPETLMMSYGTTRSSRKVRQVPVFQTSTFAFRTAEDGKLFFELAYACANSGRPRSRGSSTRA